MNNHIVHLLDKWFPDKDNFQWVLGTIYSTEGSSYRKAGSHMLFNDFGGKLGLLSGGCLESDLHRKANQALIENKALKICYDTSSEFDNGFNSGLGCGGIVNILLQPVNINNNYLNLESIYRSLKVNIPVIYRQKIPTGSICEVETGYAPAPLLSIINKNAASIEIVGGESWLISSFAPPPLLLVIGGGIDARPLVTIASQLGWQVIVADPRPTNARLEHFPSSQKIVKCKINELQNEPWLKYVDAAIVMSHNVEMDAKALRVLSGIALEYCALLGPSHRQDIVLREANISKADLAFKLAGPAGLDIGAELPESIALSILAECHAAIFNGNAKSLSQIL
ncbi:XdhC family protein [Thalassotalea atypica]|uniref:XdhC family protein n=1 Tax=Thalassotalea atypica TaxID=2054316 RepID=UPI00257223D7|nr:XdhC/CoxI family protein [Thalassotalea atypica]